MLKTLWLGLAVAVLAVTPAMAQQATPLFAAEAPVAITIDAPFGQLVRNAPRSTDPFPATLHVTGGAPAASYEIAVRPRGLTRRTGDLCNFPPLSLDFENHRAALRGTIFDGQNKLKLVTYCRTGAAYGQYVALEYTAYRLYNVLTPQSFRVRAVDVTYRDTGGRREDVTRFGFVIEDADDLARRNQMVELEVPSRGVTIEQLDARAALRVSLFHYMIGNLDWDLVAGPAGDNCCHNGKLIGARNASSGVVPVPYDFDYSGLVDAPYAVPPESVPVRTVRQRYFRGPCRFSAELPAVLAEFRARRTALLAVIDSEQRLLPATKAKAARYIEEFFAGIADDARAQRELTRRC